MEFIASLSAVELTIWSVLGLSAILGALAVASPTCFTRLARAGGQWFETKKYLEVLDKPIDIDQMVLPHSRTFGMVVVLSVALVAYVFYTYV